MSLTKDPPRFEAVTHFDGGEATVVLSGSVENAAAFALSATLDAAIDRHPTSMILDLAKLDFMGAAGLIAVTNAENRLASLGVALKVQSPSALVNRLLGIMEEAETTRLERTSPEHGHLGPEQLTEVDASTQRFASSLSTKDLRRVTSMPTDPDVVDGALRLIVELSRSSIGAADGVSVSLMRHGVLSTVAASDQTIMAMDAYQYSTGEGPCVDASVQGHWFHAESLDAEVRWPSFTPRARSLGIKAILSSPLTAFGRPVGALNIYSRTAETFEVRDQTGSGCLRRKGVGDLERCPGRSQRHGDGHPLSRGTAEPGGRLSGQGDHYGARGHRRRRGVQQAVAALFGRGRAAPAPCGGDRALRPAVGDRTSSAARTPTSAPMTHPPDVLEAYCREAGLSLGELWLRYFELGGMSAGFELEAFLQGLQVPSVYDHDVIALAINERLVELGGRPAVPYLHEG